MGDTELLERRNVGLNGEVRQGGQSMTQSDDASENVRQLFKKLSGLFREHFESSRDETIEDGS